MTDIHVVAENLAFPEGPVVMADGSVIVVEVHAGRVTRCWDGRKEAVSEPGGGPNGAAVGPDGAIYICNNGGHGGPGLLDVPAAGRIERIDPSTGRFERILDTCDGMRLSAPNDLVFDADGNLWFTDLGQIRQDGKAYGGLYCIAAGSGAATLIKGRALSYNGVGISPDGRTVYVADTYSARIYAFERRVAAQEPRLVATVPGLVSLDSLAVTEAGNVCVGVLLQGGVATVIPQGGISVRPFDDRYVTNLAFGGDGMSQAWITLSAGGLLVRTAWDEPGLRLPFNG